MHAPQSSLKFTRSTACLSESGCDVAVCRDGVGQETAQVAELVNGFQGAITASRDTDTQTDRRQRAYNLSQCPMLCYSNGTDNYFTVIVTVRFGWYLLSRGLSHWLYRLVYCAFRFSCYSMRLGEIHSRLHADGSSFSNDRWTVRIRRSCTGAPSECQYAVGGWRQPWRTGQACIRISSTGASLSVSVLDDW